MTAPLDWWYAAPLVATVVLGSTLALGAISSDEIRLVLRRDAALGSTEQ